MTALSHLNKHIFFKFFLKIFIEMLCNVAVAKNHSVSKTLHLLSSKMKGVTYYNKRAQQFKCKTKPSPEWVEKGFHFYYYMSLCVILLLSSLQKKDNKSHNFKKTCHWKAVPFI